MDTVQEITTKLPLIERPVKLAEGPHTFAGSAPSYLIDAFINNGFVYGDYPCFKNLVWPTEKVESREAMKRLTDILGTKAVRMVESENAFFLLVERNAAMVLINGHTVSNSTRIAVEVLAWSLEAADKQISIITEMFPKTAIPTDLSVWWNFWFMNQERPTMQQRKLDVIEWEQNLANYPGEVGEAVNSLMMLKELPNSGKIILWRGPPGTGKTFAIRALSWQWRQWASFHYIVDPEAFLGNPAYLMAATLDENDSPGEYSPQAKIIVLEDAGELVVEDSKQKTGQGLSRLLNLADGILGQGLNTSFLITTNEDYEKLNKAVTRKGRILQDIGFRPFTVSEANEWLANNDYSHTVVKDTTLAELYNPDSAVVTAPTTTTRRLGFKRY